MVIFRTKADAAGWGDDIRPVLITEIKRKHKIPKVPRAGAHTSGGWTRKSMYSHRWLTRKMYYGGWLFCENPKDDREGK